MTYSLLVRVPLLLSCLVCSSSSQTNWFQDDFQRDSLGREWNPTTGTWIIKDGRISISTRAYDQLLASTFYLYDTKPFSIEVTLRGIRAGIYFSLDDTSSKALSHMVRFDEKSVLVGFFNGAAEFVATNTFDSPVLPNNWTTLRVDVNPGLARYEISVNGTAVGIDTNLVFPSGYLGLQASDGLCEFKSIRVYGAVSPVTPQPPALGSPISFRHVRFVQTVGRNLEIFNPELGLLQTITSDGIVLHQRKRSVVPEATTSLRFGNRTYSIVGKRLLVKDNSGVVVDSLVQNLVVPVALLKIQDVLFVADVGARAVFQFTPRGRFIRSIRLEAIGGLKAPRGLDFYGQGGLVIADYDKLVFYNPQLGDAGAKIESLSPTEMKLSWSSEVKARPEVRCESDDGKSKPEIRYEKKHSGNHTAVLKGLEPLTRYSFIYSPSVKTIPALFSKSRTHRFTSPPADRSMMALTRLPLMYLVYRTISFRDKYPKDIFPQVPDGRTLTDNEVEYLKSATAFNRAFYFRNSSCKLVLDFDFFVVEDTLRLQDVGGNDPYWLSPNDRVARDFERAAHHFGKRPGAYAGLITPYAWINYPPRRTSALRDPSKKDTISIRQAYGGGTYGVPAPWKYGKTTGYTANPFQDTFSRQDWLITHEFHHQVDALMEVSGYADYFHCDTPWKMPGRFGEDFDFNAAIMRLASREWWLNLRFGQLAQTNDADHDGVPDDDPSLPFDEKRLGGSASSRDSDQDGLEDLTELLSGSSRGSLLNQQDTDRDGSVDARDPEPLYPINPEIPKVDDRAALRDRLFARLETANISAELSLGWSDSTFLLSCISDKPANLLFQIDANNDGWFHGFDNLQIRVLNFGDSVKTADFYLRDCSSWTDPPRDRRDILKSDRLIVMQDRTTDNRHLLTLKIPRDDRYGFNLRRGKKIGLRIGLQTVTDLWVWDELFERNDMMQVTLR